MFSTTDHAQHTHLVAVGLFSSENEEFYKLGFEAIKNACKSLFDKELNVEFSMSDGASYIGNAAATVYPGITHGNCWSHLMVGGFRNGGGLRKPIRLDSHVQAIKDLLRSLHGITNSAVFEEALPMFETECSRYIILECTWNACT